MKSHVSVLLFSVLFVLGISCEEPNVSIDRLDPGIRATFIDIDSLTSMQQSIDMINDELSQINDRLDEIDSLIDSGDPTDYTKEIDGLENAEDNLQEERSGIITQQSNVSKGNILLEQISSAEGVKELTFSEPRSVYRLPLNAKDDRTELFILYNGKINSVAFDYSTDTLLVNRTVKIIAKGLQLSTFDYDSARFQCRNNECDSDNASVIFYM